MLQKEFEERIGRKVSVELFEKANYLYIESNLDKDEWCTEFKKAAKLSIFDDALDLIDTLKTSVKNTFKEYEREKELRQEADKKSQEKMAGVAVFLIEQYVETGATKLRDAAIEILGEKEYVKALLKAGYEMSDYDRDLAMKVIG